MSLTDEQIASRIWKHNFPPSGGFAFARDIESAATAPLLEQIKELERDCDMFERNWNEAMATHRNIADLERQLEQASKDAERYRWLRVQDDDDFCFAVVKNPHFDVYAPGDELDAAIDAAIKESK
jgi:hypothetical protein